jgi:hypothetical protein
MAKLSPEAERRIEEYLGQVRAALEGWSERDRDEICENLRQHVEDALPDAPVVEEQVDAGGCPLPGCRGGRRCSQSPLF